MTTETVEEAIRRWWTAMKDQDLATLSAIVDEQCTFLGGPDGRETGLTDFLANARKFFAQGEIHEWRIDQLRIATYDQTAVATYAWSEAGAHGEETFSLDGIATDVYRGAGESWVLIARHVGMGQL
ncbi:YybH family protein [Microbacterium sp.]|uniref:YybH family protein n=1 Tax=Microbacterium sp. TaxID=51671 RepID=UPI003C795148